MQGGQGIAVHGLHGGGGEHAGFAARCPARGMQPQQRVEGRLDAVRLGLPAQRVGLFRPAAHGAEVAQRLRGDACRQRIEAVRQGQAGAGIGGGDLLRPARRRRQRQQRRAGAKLRPFPRIRIGTQRQVPADRAERGCLAWQQQRIQVVGGGDAEREEPPLAALRPDVAVEGEKPDQPSRRAQRQHQQRALADMTPPGDQPGRRLEGGRLGHRVPQCFPLRPQPVQCRQVGGLLDRGQHRVRPHGWCPDVPAARRRRRSRRAWRPRRSAAARCAGWSPGGAGPPPASPRPSPPHRAPGIR